MDNSGIDLKGVHNVYIEGRRRESEGMILSTHIKLLHKYINKDSIVLDIGCGLGQLSMELSRVAKKVYAIDPSAYNIENAKVMNNATNIEYSKGDGTKIDFEDATFDIVVSSEVIEHVKDYRKLVSEMRRLGKKDSVYCISSPNLLTYLLYPYYWFYALRHPIKYCKVVMMSDNLREYEKRYDRWIYPFTLRKYLVNSGFDIKAITTIIPLWSSGYKDYFKGNVVLFYIISFFNNIAIFIYSKTPFIKNLCNTRFFILFKKNNHSVVEASDATIVAA